VSEVSADDLRQQVRAYLENERAAGTFLPSCDSWLAGFSPSFSEGLGHHGWIGLTWPATYGGHELSPLHRFAVTEELLVAGAPVAAHWIADRQSGPSILKYGTEAQKQHFLPAIAAGRCYFAIGMSEPDSGSDLASVRTSAARSAGGWVLNGTKLWTSHAHRAHYMIALCRTSPVAEDRHAGLSQFLVDLHTPGITVNPVRLLDGSHHFNEVVLDGVQLDEDALLGQEGDGWAQVTQELTFERGGPERFLSTYPLVTAAIGQAADSPRTRETIGDMVSQLWALRELALSVLSDSPDHARAPALSAAITKEIGTRLEQSLVDYSRRLVGREADPSSSEDYERLLAEAVLHAPGFTIRGGTTEVLRGVIAKMSGLK
jgi:acyl-CoA dehydrogenase